MHISTFMIAFILPSPSRLFQSMFNKLHNLFMQLWHPPHFLNSRKVSNERWGIRQSSKFAIYLTRSISYAKRADD